MKRVIIIALLAIASNLWSQDIWKSDKNTGSNFVYIQGKDTIFGNFFEVNFKEIVILKDKDKYGDYIIITEIKPSLEFDILTDRLGLGFLNPYCKYIFEPDKYYDWNKYCIGEEYKHESNYRELYNLK